jgi:hypothetical protein
MKMDAIPGLSEIIKTIGTQCGFIPVLLIIAVAWFAWRFAKSEADRAVERTEATKRLDIANATIIRLLEDKAKSEEDLAVALAKVELRVSSLSNRSGD